MVVNRKPTGRALSIPAGLSVGAVFALIWTLAGAMITASLVSKETIPESGIGYGALFILMTASFGAAMIAYHKIKHQRVLVCLAAGGIYFGLLLAMNALFFGGQYNGVGVTLLSVLGGSGAAILVGLRQGRGSRKDAYKMKRK